MNQERLLKVLLAPHVSEKSSIVAETNNQYVFRVVSDASKPEVKAAVDRMAAGLSTLAIETANLTGGDWEKNHAQANVRMSTVKGKVKRFGQQFGRRSDWKKAYVTLKAGQEISFMGGE